jgi:phenylacetate-CoA ligase
MKNYSFPVWLHHVATRQTGILRSMDALVRSQWLVAEKIRKYELECLRDIVGYAQKNVPYYGDLFRQIGLSGPTEIRTLEDFRRIPILTKAIIRSDLDRLTAKRNDLLPYQTGGSTGVPLKFFGNRKFLNEDKPAVNYRAYSHAGFRIGDSFGVIWGYDLGIPNRGLVGSFLRSRVYKNHCELNSFTLTDAKISAFIEQVRKEKPLFFKGYATSLAEVARYMTNNGIDLGYPVKAVFSEAERLDDFRREAIERAFRTKVFNYYGSREFGTIAVECSEHTGLHVNFEQLYAEIAEDSSILVTSFLNLGTVFIRYEIGDSAEGVLSEPCRCGRQSLRLRKILGRESDNFVAPDGTIIHGEYVTHLFYDSKTIEQFQMVQHSVMDFSLDVVTRDESGAREELQAVISKLKAKFQAEMNITVRFVPTIEKTATGKRKFTISHVRREER